MAATRSGCSVPVSQMLSGKHDNNTIAEWLKDFVDAVGDRPPKEVVIDESAALLLASVKAFTQFDNVHSYMNRCHRILEGNNVPKPESDDDDKKHNKDCEKKERSGMKTLNRKC